MFHFIHNFIRSFISFITWPFYLIMVENKIAADHNLLTRSMATRPPLSQHFPFSPGVSIMFRNNMAILSYFQMVENKMAIDRNLLSIYL